MTSLRARYTTRCSFPRVVFTSAAITMDLRVTKAAGSHTRYSTMWSSRQTLPYESSISRLCAHKICTRQYQHLQADLSPSRTKFRHLYLLSICSPDISVRVQGGLSPSVISSRALLFSTNRPAAFSNRATRGLKLPSAMIDGDTTLVFRVLYVYIGITRSLYWIIPWD